MEQLENTVAPLYGGNVPFIFSSWSFRRRGGGCLTSRTLLAQICKCICCRLYSVVFSVSNYRSWSWQAAIAASSVTRGFLLLQRHLPGLTLFKCLWPHQDPLGQWYSTFSVRVAARCSFPWRIFMSARIRAGSRFKRFLRFVLIDVRCFHVSPWVRVPQVEDHCSKSPNLFLYAVE
jgi:hypothetical protein